jgi:hypothetical protein
VISRRLRLSFLNAQAALKALPCIIDIMAEDLNWNCQELEALVLSEGQGARQGRSDRLEGS